ncbi:MAG: hypothetical protein ACRDE5_09525, partial [Ginsengibacter sp.]
QKDSLTNKVAYKKRSAFGEKMMITMSQIVTADKIRKSAIGGSISALFTLFGAILMWRLKRNGFYIYIVGILIGVIVPIYLYGNNFIAIGMSSFSSLFGLVFIALYALNIKSMK